MSKFLSLTLFILLGCFISFSVAFAEVPDYQGMCGSLPDYPMNAKKLQCIINYIIGHNEDVLRNYGPNNLSYCLCRGVLFYDNVKKSLFLPFYEQGVHDLTNTGKISKISVDHSGSQCTSAGDTYDANFRPAQGYNAGNWCEYVKNEGCCCKKEEGERTIKFSECVPKNLTIENAGGCSAPPNGKCEDILWDIPGLQPLPSDAGVSLATSVLKAQAETLNQFSGLTKLSQLIGRLANFLAGGMGMLLLLFYVVAGISWMTAAGNSERIEGAKKMFVWATLGVVLMLASYVIINTIFRELINK